MMLLRGWPLVYGERSVAKQRRRTQRVQYSFWNMSPPGIVISTVDCGVENTRQRRSAGEHTTSEVSTEAEHQPLMGMSLTSKTDQCGKIQQLNQ